MCVLFSENRPGVQSRPLFNRNKCACFFGMDYIVLVFTCI